MIYFAFVAGIVFLDQFTKYWFLLLHAPIPVMGVLSLVRTEEHPDGMFLQWAVNCLSFGVNFIAAVFLSLKFLIPNESRCAIIAYGLYISGALGNVLPDYWLRGATDFIRLNLGSVILVTNMSDLYLFTGAFMMIWHIVNVIREINRRSTSIFEMENE